MYTIGIDIGGMSVKVGLVDENGKIIEKNVEKTIPGYQNVINNMVSQVNRLLKSNNLTIKYIKGIGVGCPGAVSGKKGIIDVLPNLEWENVPLVKLLQDALGVKVLISNDANVAHLAEAVFGVAKNVNDSIMLTLGTGIGGGIVINKKLYEGTDSKGAELGHSTLILGGKPCSCGRSGCIETYVSATALMAQTREAMLEDKSSKMWDFVGGNINNVNGRTAFECAKTGDATAEKVVSNYVMYLSESLMNMMNIFRPEMIILGGGVSGQGDYLINRINEYCEKYDYGYHGAPKPEIVIARFGNDAGIIGAAALIEQ
jgi:glucokinase